MQVQPDYLSVPRRELDVEDYIDILRRHWMWIVGPVFASLVVSVAVAFFWPDTFVSQAVMRITPPQLASQLVAPNFNQQLVDRLQRMHQDVTSRGRLIEMIKKFDLYPRMQARKPIEDIVEEMRQKVVIVPVQIATQQTPQQKPSAAFRISFSYEDKNRAQKVVSEIVSSFMNANAVDNRTQSRITTDLISDVLRTAKDDLDRIEGELTNFKIRNAGSLPEELQLNLQTQRSYELQLQGIHDSQNRNQQDKAMLETNIQNLRSQLRNLTQFETETVQAGRNDRLVDLDRLIVRGEADLALMKERLQPEHPDVKAATAQLETWRNERDRLASVEEKTRDQAVKRTNASVVMRQTEIDGQIKSIQTRISAINADMEEKAQAERQIQQSLRTINARIQSNPLMQGEYARLSRDYALAKEKYDDLKGKESITQMAQMASDRNAGENLEVLDPASLPLTPTDPNRAIIISAGVAIGLVLGLVLAGARELKDTTMKGLKDVRAYSNMPILSSIPLLENALLVRRKRRLTWLAWSSAMIAGVVIMSGSIYYYYWGR